MKMSWPMRPPSSSVGAKPLNTAIMAARPPSVKRRPMRSAIRPEATMPMAPNTAPTICTIRNSVIDWSEYSEIHDSGNTVIRWNSA
ncbi:hypothetical protein D9M69_480020 [compost metagenome]